MPNKAIINIVYSPQTGPVTKVFENEKGEIWRSPKYDPNKINIGMGWYSIRKPKPHDSIWVVEPYCVLDRDYDPKFVSKFKYIFSWATKAFPKSKNKVVAMNHPSYHHFPSAEKLAESWVEWNKKTDEIVFVANNKSSRHHSELYSLRLQLADLLHKKSKYKVSWYGQMPIKRPYFRGNAKSKHDVLRKAKFSICTENSHDPIYTHGYFTEKLPDVWRAGTIPIYMGCYNIDDHKFPKHSYIDLRDYVQKTGRKFRINEKGLIGRIEGFTEERYKNWVGDIRGQIFRTQKLQQLSSFKVGYEKIINKFHSDIK
ncbi:hypothetical protein LCGC14_0413700 [marine sediment metagenome]|uniref:Fucosyltransferase C-terminal domain-containing protein n=1 Tax=marine sediment metagenome TaxID=412755 RepID=A0A0F9W252_9ZZZZ|nr:hypothetical protein [Pricia sp.]